MREIFNSTEMKRVEQSQFRKKNSYSYMKKAGYSVFSFIKRKFKKIRSVSVLCGPGNNGGDGFVIAKHLMEHGYYVNVYTYLNKDKYSGDALKALRGFKGKIKTINSFKLQKDVLVVDALFGIGLQRNIKGNLSRIFRKINKAKNFVVSVDIPSGISSNNGQILGTAI